ncbi:MAG: polyphosphate kinase 2 family protein [Bifidobacterium sp.]|jgi:PPK2 family polyphosphate:nucleotide phosphotransferase|nr:polyphosphate kinase 2 family protein [Bifidobacterium sp.]MCH4174574.1 polyphosphate kinase 2 family protein [Bifidobacterium sp.]
MAKLTENRASSEIRTHQILHAVDRQEHHATHSDITLKDTDDIGSTVERSQELSSIWDADPSDLLRFNSSVQLAEMDQSATPGFPGKKADGKRFISLSSDEIMSLQHLLYANGAVGSKRRLLLILQGMDASGKGGIVQHVFSQVNPMGIHYHGFGAPTPQELQHDFLWRVRRELPKPGWMTVFDRSQYEDIVMPRIYDTYPPSVWRGRYSIIRDFERHLVDDGCAVIKVFLATSKEAQRKRFIKRLNDPTKHWKFAESDLDARERWPEYMDAWQEVFQETSTDVAPWYVVPADKRWYSRAVVSQMLRSTLQGMQLQWPKATFDLDEARQRLASE